MQLSYLITALVPLFTSCLATPIQSMPGKTFSIVIVLYSNVFPAVGRGIKDIDVNRRLLESGSLRPVERAPEGDKVIMERYPEKDVGDSAIMKRYPEEDVGDSAIMKRSPEEDVGDSAIMKRSSENDVIVII